MVSKLNIYIFKITTIELLPFNFYGVSQIVTIDLL